MTTLVATDLDRTLIYSRAVIEAHGGAELDLVAVERDADEDEDVSWLTAAAAVGFAGLHADAVVVPVTTRTPRQWGRIRLPGPNPRYAITANGGVLLVDGVPDPAWDAVVATHLAQVAPLAQVWDQVSRVCRPEWTVKIRAAGGLFCYAVLQRPLPPTDFLPEAVARADALGWRVSLQGHKLYWIPKPLTKSAALAEVVRRTGALAVLAAGDSLLDSDLLAAADHGIVARHGELVASGWSAPHVTVTENQGVRAGAEIVDWFAARLAG